MIRNQLYLQFFLHVNIVKNNCSQTTKQSAHAIKHSSRNFATTIKSRPGLRTEQKQQKNKLHKQMLLFLVFAAQIQLTKISSKDNKVKQENK